MRDERTTPGRAPYLQGSVRLPIETARLKLVAYDHGDVDEIHAVLYGDPAVRRHTGGTSTKAETRALIEKYIADQQRDGYAYWAVIERHWASS